MHVVMVKLSRAFRLISESGRAQNADMAGSR